MKNLRKLNGYFCRRLYLDIFSVDNTLPNAGEVRFHSCADSNTATMTWRYSEPRVISKLRVNPVPFTSSQEFDDEDLKVCMIDIFRSYSAGVAVVVVFIFQ